MYTYRCADSITSLRGATYNHFHWTTNLQTSVYILFLSCFLLCIPESHRPKLAYCLVAWLKNKILFYSVYSVSLSEVHVIAWLGSTVHSVSAVYSSTVLPDSDDTAFPTCSANDEHETHPNKVSYCVYTKYDIVLNTQTDTSTSVYGMRSTLTLAAMAIFQTIVNAK